MEGWAVLDTKILEGKLKHLSEELRQRGQTDLADDVGELVEALRQQGQHERPGRLMTTGEAAQALGVRSINTIKRWAAEGQLDGVRRGGRLLILAESVKRMTQSPSVAEQKAREAQIAAALEPFDAGDEEVPPTSTWTGRKPWDKRDRASA